ALANLFGDPRNAPGFVLKPRVDTDPKTHQRHYTTPETATWWHEAQAHVGPDVVIAGIILYSDVTHLSNNGRKKAHPVMMSLINISQGKHWASSGHMLLGNLLIPPAGMSSAQSTELLHKAVELMLQPILEGLKSGFKMKDPNGVEHLVIPMLYAWVCDFPESCKITCTLSGTTNRPCSICYAHRDHLCAVSTSNVNRTIVQQQGIKEDWYKPFDDKKTIGMEYSTFDVDCSLWRWDVFGKPWGNPYLVIMPDIMHQADLGILGHIVSAIRCTQGTWLPLFDVRLKSLRADICMTHMRLPNSTYFVSDAQAAAFDHRSVLQVLIFVVADKLGDAQSHGGHALAFAGIDRRAMDTRRSVMTKESEPLDVLPANDPTSAKFFVSRWSQQHPSAHRALPHALAQYGITVQTIQ
ncbi:unnamed protein product, partial [Closterium sp. NIES-54]